MKVVFLEDVEGVARGGDIKDVKNGFARNFLIPKSLAVPATHDAMQRIQKLTNNAEKTRLKTLKDMTALGEELTGVRVDIEMRAGSGGRLYGSVTNAIVATKLGELTGRQIDRRSVTIPDSVRELGIYTANIRLHTDIDAEINILVHPLGTEADEYMARLEAAAGDADEPVAEEAAEGSADEPEEADDSAGDQEAAPAGEPAGDAEATAESEEADDSAGEQEAAAAGEPAGDAEATAESEEADDSAGEQEAAAAGEPAGEPAEPDKS
jgi:large subunit ribosomal protein L9